MGGHAAFIWPALGFAAVVLVVVAATSLAKLRASERALHAAEAQAPAKRRRASGKAGS